MVTTNLKPKNAGEALKVAKVVLKRKDRNLAANAERAKIVQNIRKQRKSKPKTITAIGGDKLLRQCKKNILDIHHVKLSKHKQFMERRIPADAPCLLVARNSRIPSLNSVKNVLRKMGLNKPNECRVVSTTAANMELIRHADAYMYYGLPTAEIVSALVHKKAYVAVSAEEKQKKPDVKAVPLNNNAIIEDVLGEFGLVCVEDLVDVLLKGRNDDKFEKVSQFISSFKLNPEDREQNSKFRNSRPTRGFQPKMETFMKRVL